MAEHDWCAVRDSDGSEWDLWAQTWPVGTQGTLYRPWTSGGQATFVPDSIAEPG